MKITTKINFNGEILKESRLKQHKTLDELANAICANSRQLEAIENNNYEILQAAEIRKIIIKRYANELGIEITIQENQ
ncbi:MAG: helix-turn-helix domain-containing protein [Methylophilaceae bacterium]|jgi:cytoskeletal protein RodZ